MATAPERLFKSVLVAPVSQRTVYVKDNLEIHVQDGVRNPPVYVFWAQNLVFLGMNVRISSR